MKNTKIFSAALLTILAAGSAFAGSNCDPNALEGTWSRFEADVHAVDSGTSRVWTFAGDVSSAKVALTDSWTASGTFGPYYEKETRSEFSLSADCVLTLTAVESVARGYREFDEPTPAKSLEVVDEGGKVTKVKVSVSEDRKVLRTVGSDGLIRTWTKKN